jgi:hypothetical protein
MKTCSFEECNRRHRAKGLCSTHYNTIREGKPLLPIGRVGARVGIERLGQDSCKVDGCCIKGRSLGYCQKHYVRWKNTGITDLIAREKKSKVKCEVYACDLFTKAKGLCGKHYSRLRRHGDTGTNYHRKYRDKPLSIMRPESRFVLNCDEKEVLKEFFHEQIGANECEVVFSIEK